MLLLDEIEFKGNEKIRATHNTTFEITRENYLTKRGDCIIGINANKSVKDISGNAKNFLLNGNKIILEIKVGNFSDKIIAFGSKNLILTNEKSIVVRKSNFIDDRTLCIKSNKAAIDIDRNIINELKKGKSGKLILWKP